MGERDEAAAGRGAAEPVDSDEAAFIALVRAGAPAGTDDPRFWASVARRAERPVRAESRARALAAARLGLAVGRGELTLGRYLGQLRAGANLSRHAVARAAHLSPEIIADLESDRWHVLAVDPSRLAALAALVGAAKAALLDLVRLAAAAPPPGQSVRSSLARVDVQEVLLGPREKQPDGPAAARGKADLDSYLDALASAFDAAQARNRRASGP